MFVSLFLHVVFLMRRTIEWLACVTRQFSLAKRWRLYVLPGLILCTSLGLMSCSGLASSGGNNKTPTVNSNSTVGTVAVGQLSWCGKPLLLFRDEGATTTGMPTATTTATTPTATVTAGTATTTGTATTITDWTQVEPKLGFTVYLPTKLPAGTCLTSVLGTIHDPIFGGSFIIGYLLPDHSSISLSEAPLRTQSTAFQCSVSTTSSTASATKGTGSGTATPAATATTATTPQQVCSGAHDTTNIVFSARGTTSSLQQFFNALQPNVNWVPAKS